MLWRSFQPVVPGGAKATACAELDGTVASQLSELAVLPLGSVTWDPVARIGRLSRWAPAQGRGHSGGRGRGATEQSILAQRRREGRAKVMSRGTWLHALLGFVRGPVGRLKFRSVGKNVRVRG